MPPKKRKTGKNGDTGLLGELQSEVLDNFLPIVSQTQVKPPYSEEYTLRGRMFSAPCQVCVSYRHHFLPLLWQTLNLCCGARSGGHEITFYIHVGDALVRKCNGLSQNSELSSFIR